MSKELEDTCLQDVYVAPMARILGCVKATFKEEEVGGREFFKQLQTTRQGDSDVFIYVSVV